MANAERGGIRPDLSVLVAVLSTIAPELAEELRESSPGDDRKDLEIWLTARLGAATGADAAALLGYADSGRVWGPVEDEIVTLPDANAGLKLLGFEPLSNGDAHGRAFSHFVASQRSALLDELRDRFAERVATDPAVVGVVRRADRAAGAARRSRLGRRVLAPPTGDHGHAHGRLAPRQWPARRRAAACRRSRSSADAH